MLPSVAYSIMLLAAATLNPATAVPTPAAAARVTASTGWPLCAASNCINGCCLLRRLLASGP